MTKTALDVLEAFAPGAQSVYRSAFGQGQELLDAHGVSTPMRLAHLMGQCMHETGDFHVLVESGGYKQTGLARMWDGGNWHRYFEDRDTCLAMAEQCEIDNGEALFSLVYGGRMGNGAPDTKDGWRYRGRGLLQTTGRESYRAAGKSWDISFEEEPDLVTSAEHALKPALTEWSKKHLNAAADNNDIKVITLAINGGLVGLAERKAKFAKIWPFLTGSPAVEQTREWRVQEKLHALGYTYVVPDGVIGAKSRTAILDYRVKHGLPNSPSVTADLLLSLGVD